MLVVLVAIFFLALTMHTLLALAVFIGLLMFGLWAQFPITSVVTGRGRDVLVYENGIVLVGTFESKIFYPWESFNRYEFDEVDRSGTGSEKEMVLQMRERVHRSDPDMVAVGPNVEDREMAWDHIGTKVPPIK
jgi:hypothetical protein